MAEIPDIRKVALATYRAELQQREEFNKTVVGLLSVVTEYAGGKIMGAANRGEWSVVLECPSGVETLAFRAALERVLGDRYKMENQSLTRFRVSWHGWKEHAAKQEAFGI